MPKKHKNSSSKLKAKTRSRVEIVGEGRDEWGSRYIKFRVVGSDYDIPAFSVERLIEKKNGLFAALVNAGWNGFTVAAQNDLLERLENRKPTKPTFKVVSRVGWVSGAYVRPDEIIGSPKMRLERAFNSRDRAMLGKYRDRGTVKQWSDKIATPCTGNSRLMFSVALAFTGPILRLAGGPRLGGFQLWGGPEAGKTTAALVAGSVWGCHRAEGRKDKGFTESWNSTAGAIELTALAHNDAVLILDETRRAGANEAARAQVVTAVAFGLAEGVEKERLTNLESARSWRCYFLSTSNQPLKEIASAGRVEIDDAYLGRMTDIPLPAEGHGIYEELNGFSRGAALSEALQRRTRRHYGAPALEFLRRLVADVRSDRAAVEKIIKKERASYRRTVKGKAKSDGLRLLNRSTGRYATVFAAGSLARRYRILPWTRAEILDAVCKCQLDQLRQSGDQANQKESSQFQPRAKLKRFIEDNRSKFTDLSKDRPRYGIDGIENVPGYLADEKGQSRVYLTAHTLGEIIGKGQTATAAKKELAKEGVLLKGKDGKFVVQRRIFKGGKGTQNQAWVYAIDAGILG
jgi:putative DNA primase/helicase